MPPATACPSQRDLHRLQLGQLKGEVAADLQRHLRECRACRDALASFQIGETIVKNPPPRPATPRTVAGAVGAQAGATRASGTVAALVSSGRLPASPPDEVTQLLEWLRPSAGPGEVGRVGQYRLLNVLGAGGMGVVFQAEDTALRRSAAVKLLKPRVADDEEGRARFVREAQAAASVEHEHVITIYQVGEDRGLPYMAMQLLQGETLDARLGREMVPLLEALRIGHEIAAGLAAAHAKGLIHRDIKPSNIWLEAGRGRVKIVDFGLVRVLRAEQHLTRTGAILGTPAYMSPEQAKGAAIDARTDLYSLGCVLYRMLTGRPPYQAKDSIALLVALHEEQPPPVQSLNSTVPPSLVDLVERLLSKDPAGRPPSAEAVEELLRTIEHQVNHSVQGGTDSAWLPPRRPRKSTKEPKVAPRPRSRRLEKIAAKVLALTALAMGAYFYAPTLFRWVRDEGRVVFVGADPGVRVLIKQGGNTFLDVPASRPVDLKKGTYELEMPEQHRRLKLSRTQLRVDPGESVEVRISGPGP